MLSHSRQIRLTKKEYILNLQRIGIRFNHRLRLHSLCLFRLNYR